MKKMLLQMTSGFLQLASTLLIVLYCFQSKANQESVTHTRFLNQSRIHTLKGLSPGNYSLRVFATSSAEHGDFSPYVYFYIEERSSSTPVVWVAISVGLLIVCRVLTVGSVV
jgi:hypothetical protein